MKSLITFTLLLALSAKMEAQPAVDRGLHRQFIRSILARQTVRAQAKGIATAKRVTAENVYSVATGGDNIIDSAHYFYSGSRGSAFNFNFMAFDRSQPLTNLYGDAHSLYDADVRADSVVLWGSNNDQGTFQLEGINTAIYDAVDNVIESAGKQNDLSSMDYGNKVVRFRDAQGNITEAYGYVWNGSNWDTSSRKTITYNNSGQIIADTLKTYDAGNFYLDEISTYQYDASGNLTNYTMSGWYLGNWVNLTSYTQTYYANNKVRTSTLWFNDDFGGMVPFYKDSIGYDPGGNFYTYYQSSDWNKNTNSWVNSSKELKQLNAAGLPDSVKYYVWQSGMASYRLDMVTAYSYDADGDPVLAQQFSFPVSGPADHSYASHYYYNTGTTAPLASLSAYNCDGAPIQLTTSLAAASIDWQIDGTTVSRTDAQWGVGITVAGGNGKGNTAAKMNDATGVFVSANGDVYIADRLNHRIQKWAPGASSAVTVAGGNGPGNGLNQLNNPVAVSVYNNDIYVLDGNNNRVVRWAAGQSTGSVVAGGNGAGAATNQLNKPSGFFIDGTGSIYIADELNHRIVKWAPGATAGVKVAGKPSGGAGTALNCLNHPAGVFVNNNGDLYIADKNNDRIVKWAAGAATGTLAAGGNGAGSNPNQLNSPSAVWADGAGNVYVTDMLNYRVMRWTPGATEGKLIAAGNGSGNGVGRVGKPTGLYMNDQGVLYVADESNHRVQMYLPYINASFKVYAAGAHTATVQAFSGTVVTTNNTIVSAMDNASAGMSQGSLPDGGSLNYIYGTCKKIAKVEDAAGGNTPGNIKVAVYKEASVQTFNGRPYLQRHYDIQPASDGSAIVTLFVNPNDFKAYNSYVNSHNLSYPLLPANSTSTAAIGNIYITQFAGQPGAGTTGPGNQYDAAQKVLIPNSSITTTWNGTYWELRFPVTSMAGGFFIHSGNVAMKEQPADVSEVISEPAIHIEAYPNPTSGELNITAPFNGNEARIQLMDLSGKVLADREVYSEKTSLDLGRFTAGMYLIKYTIGSKSTILKIAKQ